MIEVTEGNLAETVASLKGEPALSPEAAWFRCAAQAPNLVVIRRPQGAWIAFVGEEPTSRAHRDRYPTDFGHSGRGYVLVDVEGEARVTHNLQSDTFVPEHYTFLFPVATHVLCKPLDLAEDARHWDALGWADREAA